METDGWRLGLGLVRSWKAGWRPEGTPLRKIVRSAIPRVKKKYLESGGWYLMGVGRDGGVRVFALEDFDGVASQV
jgi:hypothetical protein